MKREIKKGAVEKIVNGGWGIVRSEKGVVFLRGVCPGEEVEYSIKEKAKGVLWGKVNKIIKSSDIRREPQCRYYGECGGCSIQHINYKDQLKIKLGILKDDLKRFGGVEGIEPDIRFSEEFHYRIRVKLKGTENGKVGFIRKGTNEVMRIDECKIAVKKINEFIKKWNSGGRGSFYHQLDLFYNIDIKKLFVYLSDPPNNNDLKWFETFSNTIFSWKANRSIGISIINIRGTDYHISPENFFQVNHFLWDSMLDTVERYMEKSKKVADLYSGSGFFIPLLKLFSKDIVAVESNPGSVEMAKMSFKDIKSIRSAVENIDLSKVDTVIVDPPRSGLSKRLKEMMVEREVKRIIYVSCSIVTMARDLKFFLSMGYKIGGITMIDLFPNTSHFETITLLIK